MNRLIRYLLFIIFLIVSFYYAWSEGDRRISQSEYTKLTASQSPVLFRSIGYDHGAGNIIAVQAFMHILDYSSEDRFFEKINSYLIEAKKKGLLKENTFVVFPEHIGTALVLLGEKNEVYAANTVSSAFSKIARGDLIGYIKSSFLNPNKSSGEVIFKMKAEEMKKVYVDTFRKLSSSYGVTILAGSILLSEPEINENQNDILLKNGDIVNVNFLFLPDGKINSKFGVKYNLAATEKQIAVSRNPENAFLIHNNIGIVMSNDSLYNSIYGEKLKDKDVILVPSAIFEKDEIDWNSADIYGNKEAPDKSLTQSELWRKFNIFEKTKQSLSNRIALQVVLLGKFYELNLDGETAAVYRYMATEGLDNKSPAILNIWF
jgi:hypothetical protein